MYPLISYQLATARIADLRRQAQRDALARAAVPASSHAAQPGGRRIQVSPGRRRRFGMQLWTLLHAQTLLDGPTALAQQSYPHARAARQ